MQNDDYIRWREVLKAYIEHVVAMEGTDFLTPTYLEHCFPALDTYQRQALQQVAAEVREEEGK